MPRRRMVDPFFWDDRKVSKLSRDERALVLGCLGHTDDEGRLQGDTAFLKSQIFKYDKDLDDSAVQTLRDDCLAQMMTWPADHPYRMKLYHNSDEEYICFPNFSQTNRPSHPTKSQLPVPPREVLPTSSGESPETVQSDSRGSPSQVSLGQSSLGKVRLGKGSSGEVREDFRNFTSEKDLTDFLTTTLTENAPRGHVWQMEMLKQFWVQTKGQPLDEATFQAMYRALSQYPIPVMAISVVKVAKYSEGKKKLANYLHTVLEEQLKVHSQRPGGKE